MISEPVQTDARPQLRVFVSSPGDVSEERLIAERILDRLAKEFAPVAVIEPIFWEHEPLLATDNFQNQITRPSQTDIVVCILWSRLGTRLPPEFTRSGGKPYNSGTEFELEDAKQGHQQNGVPDLLVFRKKAEALVDLQNAKKARRALRQRRLLNQFMRSFFGSADRGWIAAFRQFKSAAGFETLLEKHLRKLIKRRLHAMGQPLPAIEPSWRGYPFRGLEAFDFEHQEIFFGRTRATSEVIGQLRRQAETGRAFLLVLGVSGCGKSSLVRAGVLPMLVQSTIVEGVGLWRRAILRPAERSGDLFDCLANALLAKDALPELASDGTTPEKLAELLRANPASAHCLLQGYLSKAAGSLPRAKDSQVEPAARLVLVLDQLEELFTASDISREHREAFFEAVRALAKSGQTWVIATLRSDFYHHCAAIPALLELKSGAGQYDLSSPHEREIEQMLQHAAQAAGLQFEKNLETGRCLEHVLLDAMKTNGDSLPLLGFTLDQLYRRRSGSVLTLEAYEKLGGLEGAIGGRADEAFSKLPADAQAVLPDVFRRLVAISGDDGETVTRRPAPLDQFDDNVRPGKSVLPSSLAPARTFVEAFVAARLFTAKDQSGVPVVEISHEALLGRWKQVADWLATDKKLLRYKANVEREARQWSEHGRRDDLLLPVGIRLTEGQELLSASFPLSPVERELIDQSEAARRRDENRRRVVKTTVMAVFVALSLVCVLLAVNAYQQANRRTLAVQRELALSYLRQGSYLAQSGHITEGMEKFYQAYHTATDDDESLRASARNLLGGWSDELPLTVRHDEAVNGAAVAPSGQWLATASGKSAQLWNAATGRPWHAPLSHPGTVRAVAFSSQAAWLLAGCDDGSAHLWDSATGKLQAEMQHGGAISAVAFSPDGKLAMTAGADKQAKFWEAATGKPSPGLAALQHDAPVTAIAFGIAPESKAAIVATGCGDLQSGSAGYVQLWNAATAKPIGERLPHDSPVLAVALSHDGRLLLVGCALSAGGDTITPGYAQLWELQTVGGEPGASQTIKAIRRCRLPHDENVVAVSFTSDDQRIVTASENKTWVWNVSDCTPAKQPTATTQAFAGQVVALALDASDSQFVAWNDYTHKTFAAQLRTTSRLPRGPAFRHDNQVSSVAFGGDGTTVVTGSWDHTACVWNAKTGLKQVTLEHPKTVYAVATGRDADQHAIVLTGCVDGQGRLWEIVPGKEPQQQFALPHAQAVTATALGGDGSRWLALTGSEDKTVRLWDAADGQPIGEPWTCEFPVSAVALSPDARSAAAGCRNGFFARWNMREDQPRWTQPNVGDSSVLAIAFSPDGRTLATGSFRDGSVRFWDAATGGVLAGIDPLVHTFPVWGIAYSPDGRTLLTGCGIPDEQTSKGYAQFWDRLTGEPLGNRFAMSACVNGVAVSSDGRSALLGLADHTARLWDVPRLFPADERVLEAWFAIRVQFAPDGRGAFKPLGFEDFSRNWKILEAAGYP